MSVHRLRFLPSGTGLVLWLPAQTTLTFLQPLLELEAGLPLPKTCSLSLHPTPVRMCARATGGQGCTYVVVVVDVSELCLHDHWLMLYGWMITR